MDPDMLRLESTKNYRTLDSILSTKSRQFSQDTTYLLKVAQVNLILSDIEQAKKAYEKVLTLAPTSVDANLFMGNYLFSIGFQKSAKVHPLPKTAGNRLLKHRVEQNINLINEILNNYYHPASLFLKAGMRENRNQYLQDTFDHINVMEKQLIEMELVLSKILKKKKI